MITGYSSHSVAHLVRAPVEEFLSRPKKDLRAQVVLAGYLFYAHKGVTHQADLEILYDILEWIHAGSLIVDDIQDDSWERRGKECLHRIYGMPSALNAANWMYFEAMMKINDLQLEEVTKLNMMNLILKTMSLAHQGQAIDLMTNVVNVPREEVYELGMLGHDLKTGALFSLALQLGALLTQKEIHQELLDQLGRELGRSLQRFDDLSNFKMDRNNSKALEDLRLGRPCWPWMYLTKFGSESDYYRFREAVELLPDTHELEKFLEESRLSQDALQYARTLHQEFYQSLDSISSLKEEGIIHLKKIIQKVFYAYI